jgi:hypothetical protein
LVLLFVASSLISSFRYSLFLFTKCLTSCLILFRLYPLILHGSCNHCNLAYFIWPNNSEHLLSNHGLCFFSS